MLAVLRLASEESRNGLGELFRVSSPGFVFLMRVRTLD